MRITDCTKTLSQKFTDQLTLTSFETQKLHLKKNKLTKIIIKSRGDAGLKN